MEDEKIVGMVAGYTENIVNNSAYIAIVAVKKRMRGCGIAKKLIYEFIDECTDKKIQSVNLYTHKSNYVAIRMYKELGFVEETNQNYRHNDIHLVYNIKAKN